MVLSQIYELQIVYWRFIWRRGSSPLPGDIGSIPIISKNQALFSLSSSLERYCLKGHLLKDELAYEVPWLNSRSESHMNLSSNY